MTSSNKKRPIRWRLRSYIFRFVPSAVKIRHVAKDEIITRFVFDRDHFKKEKVRYPAFLDNRHPEELSVFRIRKLLINARYSNIWLLAKLINPVRTVKARADLVANEITALIHDEDQSSFDLIIETDIGFHPLHCNIKNYPLDQARRLSLAQRLEKLASSYKAP